MGLPGRPELLAHELEQLLRMLYKVYGYDFTDYSKSSLLRRILKFMDENELHTGSQLIQLLAGDTAAFQAFLETITVNVTEMFRDPVFYTTLREKVLPVLATYPQINIWHAGCSTGEEVFSLCILLFEAGLLHRTRIYATDINAANLEKARTGVLPMHHMREYTVNYRQAGGKNDFSDYYTALYDHVIINKEMRERVVFLQHNLVTDRSFNEFQLVLCRNVMIYFNKQLQNKVLKLFYDSLSSLGFLALGMKESLLFSEQKSKFSAIDPAVKIFRKKH
ncbi:CheR family methyltransferase [Sediminibacterium goheungense]|uniref:Chemotaxis protein methyltransferase CheR n=1 Tax=Sediminibacterium goheungense TaxID=1086393 RepID=A0A4R6J0H6_9BACT|nr:protein-glutamate O-methyltransferase CheR [Sediminibacterium goheungense]TDO28690.1 chemotaxis protein methyltransferase CheR [Sediminibacterium goheungense]